MIYLLQNKDADYSISAIINSNLDNQQLQKIIYDTKEICDETGEDFTYEMVEIAITSVDPNTKIEWLFGKNDIFLIW